MSETLRDIRGLEWPRKGSLLPQQSAIVRDGSGIFKGRWPRE